MRGRAVLGSSSTRWRLSCFAAELSQAGMVYKEDQDEQQDRYEHQRAAFSGQPRRAARDRTHTARIQGPCDREMRTFSPGH